MREPETQGRPSVVRVMPEYMSSGIWAAEPDGWFRHGMLTHDSLGLPATLAARFDAWIDADGSGTWTLGVRPYAAPSTDG